MVDIPEGFEIIKRAPAIPEGFERVGIKEQPQASQQAVQSLGSPALDVLNNIAAGVNRSVLDTVDFLGTDTINSILQLSGVDARLPSLASQAAKVGIGVTSGEDGLSKDLAQGFGAALPAAAGFAPVTGRNLATVGGTAAELLGIGAASPAQQVVRQGAEAAIPVMTSDVLPPKTFVGKSLQQVSEKLPVVGTGSLRETQQRMRQEAVERVANNYGEYSFDAIVQSLKSKSNKVKSAAGNVMESAANKIDSSVDVTPTVKTKAAISSVKDELTKPNVIKSSEALSSLEALIDAIEQPQSFTSLKENRTAFREVVESFDKADRSQMTSRAKSLLNGVYNAMTSDMDSIAKQALGKREFMKWKNANRVYRDEAINLTKTKLKNILDKGDVIPEQVKTMLFSKSPSEQKILYEGLTQEGRVNARSAIISKIVGDVGSRRSGLTPNAFAAEMKKHGDAINTFFKGDERKQLRGLQRVLEATYRAQEAGVSTPTGQQLIPLLTGASAIAKPVETIAAGGTIGALSRLYESAPVRNALLELGSKTHGSKGYAQALLNAQLVLTSSIAGQNSQQEQQQ